MKKYTIVQVVCFVKACMSIPESVLFQDQNLVNFYLRLHYHQFRTMYEDSGPKTETADWKLCNLHLEVCNILL